MAKRDRPRKDATSTPKKIAKKRGTKATGAAEAIKGGPLPPNHNGGPTIPTPPAGTSDDERALFLQHRSSWSNWLAKLAVVEKLEKDVKTALKADGFTVKQFQIADQLAGSPKQEAKVRCEVKDRLKVAWWVGHPMGAQLDLFAQPDRTPSVDRAYDEGRQAVMENQPAKPNYSPETEQYRSYMAGFHDQTEKAVRRGMKPIEESHEPVGEGENIIEDHDHREDDDDGMYDEVETGDDYPAAGFGPSRLPADTDI